MSEKKKKILTVISVALAVLLLVLLIVLDKPSASRQSEDYLDYFDTASTLYDYSGDGGFSKISSEVGNLMAEYHKLFDIHKEYEGINNLCTLNSAGGSAVVLDERVIALLEWGIEIHRLTEGEVNIAMGSVTTLWKTSLKEGRIPTDRELSEAAMHTDISKIIIDRAASTVRLADEKMLLDVGAVAKGYAEEKIAEWLIERGKPGYALDMGGNLRVIGAKPSGEGVLTGIRNPNTEVGGFIKTFYLLDEASATSGGYERFYEVLGEKYHHIIDKDTLYPAELYLSASIITESAALADALSTAVFCMTEDEISALLERLDEKIEIIIVDKDGNICDFDK